MSFTKLKIWKLSLICATISMAYTAMGAEVVYIDPELRFAIIDQGQQQGLSPGTNVCMLNAEGFILTCSGIVVANKSKSALRMPQAEMERIQVGNKVTIKTIYLKDDTAPGQPENKVTFRVAKVAPESLPATVSMAAAAKEREISVADGSANNPEVAIQSTNDPTQPATVQIVDQDPKDPYSDLGKLGNIVKIDKEDKAKKNPDRLTAKELRARTRFKAFTSEAHYLYPLSSATTFNAPKFATVKQDSEGTNSLWAKQTKKSGSESGFAVQMRFISPRESVFLFGWRHIRPTAQVITTTLDASFPDIEARTETTVESTGLWIEKVWRLKPRDFTITDFGYGIDLDTSDVNFKSDFGSPSNKNNPQATGLIGHARSRITSLCLRGSVSQSVVWNSMSINIGLSLYAPVYTLEKTYSASGKAPASANLTSDVQEDIRKAIDHKPSGMASDLHLGVGYEF